MISLTNLGKCADAEVPKLAVSCWMGKLRSGDAIQKEGKTYIMRSCRADVCSHNEMGKVLNHYELHPDGEWYLHDNSVQNARGAFRRGVEGDNIVVSLNDQQAFVRQVDGTYVQPAYANYPARRVTSEEMENAISYINGQGSVENYTKLLR